MMRPVRHLALVALAVLVVACGASQRERTLRLTLATTDATAAGFAAWDGQHQLELVATAPTRAEAEAALASYQARRAVVIDAFEAAYRSLAAAALDAKAGAIGPALETVQAVYQLVKELQRTP